MEDYKPLVSADGKVTGMITTVHPPYFVRKLVRRLVQKTIKGALSESEFRECVELLADEDQIIAFLVRSFLEKARTSRAREDFLIREARDASAGQTGFASSEPETSERVDTALSRFLRSQQILNDHMSALRSAPMPDFRREKTGEWFRKCAAVQRRAERRNVLWLTLGLGAVLLLARASVRYRLRGNAA